MKVKIPMLYIVMLVIMTLLTGVSFVCSNMFPANYYEYTLVEWDSIGIHALLLAGLLCYFVVLRPRFLNNVNWDKAVRYLLPCSLLVVLAGSLYWAIRCEYIPVWDPEYVCRAARMFSEGKSLNEADLAYFSRYPQQMGLVWLFSLIIRVFGIGGEAYMTLHIFLAVCVPLIIWNGYLLTDALFEDKEVAFYYLLCSTGCLALLFYVNFIYSDIPGILLVLSAVNGIIYYEKTGKVRWGLVGSLLFILAILIRKHNLIPAIAVVLIWILCGIMKRDRKRLAEALFAGMVIFGGSTLLGKVLESMSGLTPGAAEPSIAWVAMGMQRSAYGAGWFNGFVDNVYWDKGGDIELIIGESLRQIKMSLMGFLREPLSGIKFYAEKLMIQWNQPSYQCLGVSKEYGTMPGGIVEAIYQGTLFSATRVYFDCYQWFVYMGFTIYLWKNRKRKEHAAKTAILVLAIFGGIVFSLLWEAKSRYILPYLVMMLPYAAKGWCELRKV